MNTLTAVEKQDLALFKEKISRLHTGLIELAELAVKIRDRKLWRDEAKTWEEFCQNNWGWTRRRLNQIIQAGTVVQQLAEQTGTIVPTESQARALISVPQEQRAAVVKQAAATGQPLTAKTIKEAVANVVGPETRKDALRVDNVGQVIPAKILELWDRAEADSLEMIHWSAKLKARFKRGMDEGDIIFVEHSANEMFARMRDIRWSCKDLRPYAICYTCQGRIPTQCTTCKGRGFLSFFKWDRQSNEAKSLIAKAVASRK